MYRFADHKEKSHTIFSNDYHQRHVPQTRPVAQKAQPQNTQKKNAHDWA